MTFFRDGFLERWLFQKKIGIAKLSRQNMQNNYSMYFLQLGLLKQTTVSRSSSAEAMQKEARPASAEVAQLFFCFNFTEKYQECM